MLIHRLFDKLCKIETVKTPDTTRMITGILLKSYLTVARLMGDMDRRRKSNAKVKLPGTMPAVPKKVKLKQA